MRQITDYCGLGFLVRKAFAVACIGQLRQTEVQNLGFTPIRNEDIRWLDIPMDDAFFVSRGQTFPDLNRQVK